MKEENLLWAVTSSVHTVDLRDTPCYFHFTDEETKALCREMPESHYRSATERAVLKIAVVLLLLFFNMGPSEQRKQY